MIMTKAQKIRIICLGNELVHDDGVGVRVGRVLRELDLPEGVSVELRRVVGLELLDELEGDEALILVDASHTGGEPGTCQLLELDVAVGLARSPYCSHGMSLAEILEIARRMFPERLPRRVSVVAIEALQLERYGTTLTPPVKAALPVAVDLVLEAIGASEDVRQEGRRRSLVWGEQVLGIKDVVGEPLPS
jgi:hydrogenase maturation protease